MISCWKRARWNRSAWRGAFRQTAPFLCPAAPLLVCSGTVHLSTSSAGDCLRFVRRLSPRSHPAPPRSRPSRWVAINHRMACVGLGRRGCRGPRSRPTTRPSRPSALTTARPTARLRPHDRPHDRSTDRPPLRPSVCSLERRLLSPLQCARSLPVVFLLSADRSEPKTTDDP